MDITLGNGDARARRTSLLVVPVFESEVNKSNPQLAPLDKALSRNLFAGAEAEGFKGKPEQSFLLHTHRKLRAGRVLLLGLGPRNKFGLESLRLAMGRAAKTAQRLRAPDMAVALSGIGDPNEVVEAAAEGLLLGSYRFDRYRTQGKEDQVTLKSAELVFTERKPPAAKEYANSLQWAKRLAEATNWARDIVNEPAGNLTPSRLAEEAQAIAKSHGLEITVSDAKEIAKLKMGMFLGVAQGSAEPPRLVHLWYTPKNETFAAKPPLALVGKAITFDSGGLSLKSADGMVDMKSDMAGSAAVLAAMRMVARIKPPFPVHAFLGACENMPSGTAYRPGDILISRLGKTVEITNTDAEGRLVLGDVLAWACELKPSAVIDLATLTGACVVALGNYIIGAFGENDALMNEVLEAGKRAGEELWRMPVTDLQKDALKSEVADMKNSGERWGGAINAALFLREFVGKVPWVHLDIAGPSLSPKERGYYNKGATGCGVRTLVELIRTQAETAGRA